MTPPVRIAAAVVSTALAAAALGTPVASAGTRTTATTTTTTTATTTTTTTAADQSSFGTLANIRRIVGADTAFTTYGVTGKGIDVALIDTGVSPVPGLTSGNVVNGPDLSFDSQNPAQTYLDGFGHGTHMAGLIVGRDTVQTDPRRYADSTGFVGIAPDARLVNVKVGAVDGAVDVSQVLAALNWVAEKGQSNGLNIRVVSLSYGTDSLQDYRVDPLAHALEAVHKKGITVVVSGGNDGSDKTFLGMPAQSPRAIAVGGQDPMGTLDVKDDTVPAFANRGDNKRNVDFVAPAVSVQSLRVPGSWIDEHHPEARSGDRLLKGSGTSQAAAIVAGAAALYLQRFPTATPDQVKYVLKTTAVGISSGSSATRGSGAVNIGNALGKFQNYKSNEPRSTGTGSLEGSRGSVHVVDYPDDSTDVPVVLQGERDLFGPFDTQKWAAKTDTAETWSRTGEWMGKEWTGVDWSASSWTGPSWSGRSWSGTSWSGRSWSGRSWSGRSWSGRSWSDGSWDGRSWSGRSWSGRSWSSAGWSTGGWQ